MFLVMGHAGFSSSAIEPNFGMLQAVGLRLRSWGVGLGVQGFESPLYPLVDIRVWSLGFRV